MGWRGFEWLERDLRPFQGGSFSDFLIHVSMTTPTGPVKGTLKLIFKFGI